MTSVKLCEGVAKFICMYTHGKGPQNVWGAAREGIEKCYFCAHNIWIGQSSSAIMDGSSIGLPTNHSHVNNYCWSQLL